MSHVVQGAFREVWFLVVWQLNNTNVVQNQHQKLHNVCPVNLLACLLHCHLILKASMLNVLCHPMQPLNNNNIYAFQLM